MDFWVKSQDWLTTHSVSGHFSMEFIKLLEDGRLEEVVVESVQKSVVFNDQAYRAAIPVPRSFLLTGSEEYN